MTLEEYLGESKAARRVCPQPRIWQTLYEMLPEKHRRGNGWEPSLPLILGAWNFSSDEEKAQRFEEHLRWADSKGKLPEIIEFLAGLPDGTWHHFGE